MSSDDLTVRAVTRELMRRWGLTTVFGNPGSTEVGFLTDWPDDFRYVLGLQESVAVSMADGYAQMRGDAAMVNLHSAGGLGNGLGAIFTAYRNQSPMIVLVGQQARPLLVGEPFLGAGDAVTFPQPYVKWACEPSRPADVPSALQRAYHVATQPPCGPVFLSVPADDWNEPAPPVEARPRIPGFAPDPQALRELASALDRSERPAFVAGPAVDAAGVVEEMVRLAERTRAGVWSPPMSPRCSFPEDHPYFAGFLPPEQRGIAAALAEYDLVVVLGGPAFVHHVFHGFADRPMPELHIVHDDPQALAWADQAHGILGTMRLAVPQLLESVEAQVARAAPPARQRPERPAPTTPMSAAYVYDTLAGVLPPDALVVEEAPSHRGDLHDHLPIRARGAGFLTMASGSLGFGLAAAVGAQLAQPGRKVVSVVGDGSSMYGIQALWSAAREHTPVTFVVLDNARYRAVADHAALQGGTKIPGIELGELDFARLARSMGCAGRYVDDPAALPDELKRALDENAPVVLHVKVGA
jgi:benzoylformate decarboxylase